MKNKILLTIFLIFLLFSGRDPNLFAVTKNNKIDQLKPTDYQQQVSLVVITLLQKYHYNKTELNDSLSSLIFNNYISGFDDNKLYFTQSDINYLEKYRYELDDALMSGNLSPAYDIFNLFGEKFVKRNNYALNLIKEDFDFNKVESISTSRENDSWASSEKELDDYWRKYIKNAKLDMILEGTSEDKIEDNLTKRYTNLQEWIEKLKSDDVFQFYMNSVTESFDPHTNYFLPVTYDNFMINMSQSLEGIGARLQTENEYTKIADIIPGGPAFKSKKLFDNDKIIAVAQGEDGEWVDIIGWRIDDVVQIIRGPKDTVVRLKILREDEGPSADPVEVTLVRDKIKIEEEAPSKEVMTIYRGNKAYRIGVITVPSFYLDFEGVRSGDPDYKSTTRDVKKLLADLNKENIDGLLLDLRDNGGGSLAEAIELTGLFIPDGPVVQIKNTNGSVEVQKDEDKNMYYDGPMGVLINRFSASASEIFTGAIQDYKRGIIIGEQSYGKGTVQNLFDLDRFFPNNEDKKPGELKMTLAKFYRVTGSSTQRKGVIPDISLPSRFAPGQFGESAQPSALPWDQITSTKFKPLNFVNNNILNDLEEKYEKRLKHESSLIELEDDIKDFKALQNKKEISLNMEERKKEKEEMEKEKANREKLYGSLRKSEVDEVKLEGTDVKDPYLKEGLNIIADWVTNRIG